MRFCVLMAVYVRENPRYFDKAMKSIWDYQILKPDEIILVEDGVLTNELYKVIDIWRIRLKSILKIIKLPNNIGLALALNEGLKECNFEYIARMDTDDICTDVAFPFL